MNQKIYISKVIDLLVQIPGVVNVIDIKFLNITGGNYSSISSSQANGATILTPGSTTISKEMTPVNNEILSNEKTILELRFPNSDININTVLLTNNNSLQY